MKAPASKRSLIFGSCALVLALAPLPAALAQDSAFLACEQFSDRAQRIACLEDALEAATTAEQEQPVAAEPAAPAASPSPTTTPTPPPPTITTREDPVPAAVAEEEEEDGPSLLERLRNFGKETITFEDDEEEGREQLNDTITALEKHGTYWIVTLSSGQVWEQDYPRALNLRVGDAITIYQAGIGDGYRLSTERLSGFIRVKRVR